MVTLIYINSLHEIYDVFDANPTLEVRSAFLDMYRGFDMVWHKVLFKIKYMDVNRNLI